MEEAAGEHLQMQLIINYSAARSLLNKLSAIQDGNVYDTSAAYRLLAAELGPR